MGFANPIDLLRFRDTHGTNDVTDAMLILLEQKGPSPITQFTIACSAEGFASLNTVHKYMRALFDMGFVESVADPDDQRVRLVQVTRRGSEYLDAWVAGGDAANQQPTR